MYMYVGLELQKELEMYKKMNNGMSLEIEKLKSLVNVKEGTVSHTCNSTYMYLHVHKPVIYFSTVVFVRVLVHVHLLKL